MKMSWNFRASMKEKTRPFDIEDAVIALSFPIF